MTRDEFWRVVATIGWGTRTTDCAQAKQQLLQELTLAEAKSLREHFRAAVGELNKAVRVADLGSFCCDSWDDVTAHVVGLGRVEHRDCVANPARLIGRYDAGDYVESFAYCLPYEEDFQRLSLEGFAKWIDRELQTYREALEPGFCDSEFQLILAALELVKAGDVPGFLETQKAGEAAAEAIAEEAYRRIQQAQKYGGGSVVMMIDGGSVANKWGIWNLYREIREYLGTAA